MISYEEGNRNYGADDGARIFCSTTITPSQPAARGYAGIMICRKPVVTMA